MNNYEYRIFADLPGFNNPSIITGERYCPDLLLENTNKSSTVGLESNLKSNAHRKKTKYKHLINKQKLSYNDVKFINLSISTLGLVVQKPVSLTLG